jgi:hypothetical protein
MMTTPMTNVLFLALALPFIGLSAIDSAQARTLPGYYRSLASCIFLSK